MVEHLQSGDHNMVLEDSSWQPMPHFWEIGCTKLQGVSNLIVSIGRFVFCVQYTMKRG